MFLQELAAFCGLDKNHQKLLSLYGQSADPQTDLAAWLAGADFEALPPDISCLAAAMGAAGDFAGLPPLLIPRLQGIRKYVRTLNAGQMAGVCALGAALTQAGIPVLLLDDTALYMAGPQAAERHLWQSCMGVPAADYSQCLALARGAGFQVKEFQTAALAEQGVLRRITVVPLEPSSYLWQGAKPLRKGAAEFLCPDAAALWIRLGQRCFRALTEAGPRAAVVRWCMDMKAFLPRLSEADRHRAGQIAAGEHARLHMAFLFAVYEAATGHCPEEAEIFGTRQDAERILHLMQALRRCSQTGAGLRRRVLLYRLRRPDSFGAAAGLMLRQALRKLGL